MTVSDGVIWLYRLSNILMDLVVIYCALRCFWETLTNAKTRKIDTVLHSPIIFYCFVHSGGFLLQQLLLVGGWTCYDMTVLLATQIGTFGGFGFLPGLYVSVYIPYLVFKKSERLQIVDSGDVLMAFAFTLVGTSVAWCVYMARDQGRIQVTYMHCAIRFSTTALIICIETLIFSISISVLWLFGLKIYFSAVYHDDEMNAVDVLKRVSVAPETMRRMSIASRFSEISRASLEQHDSFGSFSQNQTHTDEFEQQITKVVETYGAEFRRCWMFTMINLAAYCGAIICELVGLRIGPLWFISGFVIKLCGLLSSWLFFQSKIMRHQKKSLIPEIVGESIKLVMAKCNGDKLCPSEGKRRPRDSTPAILRSGYLIQQFYE